METLKVPHHDKVVILQGTRVFGDRPYNHIYSETTPPGYLDKYISF